MGKRKYDPFEDWEWPKDSSLEELTKFYNHMVAWRKKHEPRIKWYLSVLRKLVG